MGLFDKLFGRKKQPEPSTSELARERLTLMLVHDRLKLTPDLLDRIKGELLEVISKYVEIDESGVDVELTHTEHSDKLVARMPVKRQRIHFERDVLEPGMGNPIVAATALAKIHQSPAEAEAASAADAPTQEAAKPPVETTPAATTAESAVVPAASPEPTQEAPAPAAAAAPEAAPESAAPAASAEQEAPAAAEASAAEVSAPAAPPVAEQTAEAESTAAAKTGESVQQPTAQDASTSAAPAQETPAPSAEAGAAPAGDGTAAEGSVSVEAPAPAATPTKG